MHFNLDELRKRPDDFKILERVPYTCEGISWPLVIDCPAGDEIPLLLADCETTGFDAKENALTELGLTRVLFSPSLGRITSIVDSKSWLQAPLMPIPEFITKLTGITDDDVKGRIITAEDIAPFLIGDPIVIAHGSDFDRPFLEKYVPFPQHLKWACSIKEIDWAANGVESKKLEYIVLKAGYFYSGHRADIDTLAMCWVFFKRPELLVELLGNVEKRTAVIRAYDLPIACKDAVKSKRFKWDDGSNGLAKHWHLSCDEEKVEEVMSLLSGLYDAKTNAVIEYFDATVRFK